MTALISSLDVHYPVHPVKADDLEHEAAEEHHLPGEGLEQGVHIGPVYGEDENAQEQRHQTENISAQPPLGG